MHADVPNYEPSLMLMNCGDARLVRPSAGAWVTYGLGTENQNLPGFVAMCPGGYPLKGTENWRSAFLPSVFQGTFVDTEKRKVEELVEYVRHPLLAADVQRRQVDLTAALDREHLAALGVARRQRVAQHADGEDHRVSGLGLRHGGGWHRDDRGGGHCGDQSADHVISLVVCSRAYPRSSPRPRRRSLCLDAR